MQRSLRKIIIHENYRKETNENDIALAQLDTRVEFSNVVHLRQKKTGRLARESFKILVGYIISARYPTLNLLFGRCAGSFSKRREI